MPILRIKILLLVFAFAEQSNFPAIAGILIKNSRDIFENMNLMCGFARVVRVAKVVRFNENRDMQHIHLRPCLLTETQGKTQQAQA